MGQRIHAAKETSPTVGASINSFSCALLIRLRFIPLPIDRDPDALRDHVLKAIAEAFLVPEPKNKKPGSVPPPAYIAWPKGVQITFDQANCEPAIKFASEEDRKQLLEQLRIPPLEQSSLNNMKPKSSQVLEEEPSKAEELDEKKAVDESEEALEEVSGEEVAPGPVSPKESFPIEVADAAWMGISLCDPATKFKVHHIPQAV